MKWLLHDVRHHSGCDLLSGTRHDNQWTNSNVDEQEYKHTVAPNVCLWPPANLIHELLAPANMAAMSELEDLEEQFDEKNDEFPPPS